MPGYLGIRQCSLYGLSLQPDNGVAVTYHLLITNINAHLISLNVISTAGHHRRRAELTISGIRLLAQDPLLLVISVISYLDRLGYQFGHLHAVIKDRRIFWPTIESWHHDSTVCSK